MENSEYERNKADELLRRLREPHSHAARELDGSVTLCMRKKMYEKNCSVPGLFSL
uniref:Uncharacterized protein n=1 Tax=Arundo donax TaxID=35708 RepID=A0A0A9DLG9_ARUDO